MELLACLQQQWYNGSTSEVAAFCDDISSPKIPHVAWTETTGLGRGELIYSPPYYSKAQYKEMTLLQMGEGVWNIHLARLTLLSLVKFLSSAPKTYKMLLLLICWCFQLSLDEKWNCKTNVWKHPSEKYKSCTKLRHSYGMLPIVDDQVFTDFCIWRATLLALWDSVAFLVYFKKVALKFCGSHLTFAFKSNVFNFMFRISIF